MPATSLRPGRHLARPEIVGDHDRPRRRLGARRRCASSPARRAIARRSAARAASVRVVEPGQRRDVRLGGLRDRRGRRHAGQRPPRAAAVDAASGSAAIMRLASTISASADVPVGAQPLGQRRRARRRASSSPRWPRAPPRSGGPAPTARRRRAGSRRARSRPPARPGWPRIVCSLTAPRGTAALERGDDDRAPTWRRDPGGRSSARPGTTRVPCAPASGSVARMPSSAAARAAASAVGERRAAVERRRAARRRAGPSASTMVLSPGSRRAELDDAVQRRVERVGERRRLDRLGVAERLAGPPQSGAPQRPAGATDGRDQRRARGHQQLARRRRRRRARPAWPATAVNPRCMLAP